MLHAKDLGGHLNYSKRGTNYSVRARITQSKPMWGWLSRSQASAHRKLRVLFTVAWPRCLHGVSAVDIGIDHVTTLRASAMSALRWEKHGSSSCIQFGLITDPRRDPHTSMQFCRPWPSFDSTANPILRMRSLTFWLANRQPGTCQVLVGSSLLDCTKSIGNGMGMGLLLTMKGFVCICWMPRCNLWGNGLRARGPHQLGTAWPHVLNSMDLQMLTQRVATTPANFSPMLTRASCVLPWTGPFTPEISSFPVASLPVNNVLGVIVKTVSCTVRGSVSTSKLRETRWTPASGST